MTLDEMLADAKALNDDDLAFILRHLALEKERRDDAERKEDWAKVCEAIYHYTANYGAIRVADFCGDENIEIVLHHGEFAFSEYGDIEVGA